MADKGKERVFIMNIKIVLALILFNQRLLTYWIYHNNKIHINFEIDIIRLLRSWNRNEDNDN